MIIIKNSRERGRFMRFAVVGIIGAVVDFGVMNLLVNLFAMPFLYAGIISFICAILSNFTWNRYWTYPNFAYQRGQAPAHRVCNRQCDRSGYPDPDPGVYGARLSPSPGVLVWHFNYGRVYT